jgi:group I intron endonuclease
LSAHKRDLERHRHDNIILQRHFDKYGWDDFVISIVEVIDFVSKKHLLGREQFYIDANKYRDTNKPYFNIFPTPGSPLGMKFGHPSEEKIEKLRKGSMGNKNMLGKHLSQETKNKISKGNRGKPKSAEHRMALSIAQKARRANGIPESEETRRRRSDALKGRIPWSKGFTKNTHPSLKSASEKKTGRHRPKEECSKISNAMTGKKQTPEHIQNARIARWGK